MQAVVPLCSAGKKYLYDAVLGSSGTAADTSVSLARQQQGEQAAAGVGIVLVSFRLCTAPPLTDITEAQ